MKPGPTSDPSPSVTRDAALREHGRRFAEHHGLGPADTGTRVFYAPGRVNLLGAHLDYNGGPVMPAAIDRGTFLALRPRPDRILRLASTEEEGEVEVSLDRLPNTRAGRWWDYPLGVARFLRDVRAVSGGAGWDVEGADLYFGGNLPIGAGLSSSASICVATAHALLTVWTGEADPLACIETALYAERRFVGVQCGIMDPYAVALARADHLLWLDCKDASFEHIPVEASKLTIAVADTGIRRTLAEGEFNRRVDECARAFELLRPHAPEASCLRDVPAELLDRFESELPPEVARRARHVVGEVERTFRAREALLAGDLAGFGTCLTDAHASLRDHFEVSIPELDHLVAAATEWKGTLGARLTGAGFGGCVVCCLRSDQLEGFREHLSDRFEARFGRRPPVEFFGGGGGPMELGS